MSNGLPKLMGVDFAQFVHGGPNEPDELCYLYHLDPPLKHAQHYLGTTENLERARASTAVQPVPGCLKFRSRTGGSWHLVRTWAGGRLKERALKMQSGKRYCPECTEHPRAGDEMPNPRRHFYFTRKERAAMKAEKGLGREGEGRAGEERPGCAGPGIRAAAVTGAAHADPRGASGAGAGNDRNGGPVGQAGEGERMKQAEIEARHEGGQAGEREVLEGIERGMDPDEAMARHEEIAGLLDREAETPQDRAFADAYWISGRYAGESVREEIRDPQRYAELEPREQRQVADAEMGA